MALDDLDPQSDAFQGIRVVPEGDLWTVKRGSEPNPIVAEVTLERAEEIGRRVARAEGLDFVVLRADGSIGERESFGET
jgi:hypothetical protein